MKESSGDARGKSDDLESTSTYRPICVLNVIGKMYEILMRKRLVAVLNGMNAISERQLNFCKSRLTTQAVFRVTDPVMKCEEI